MFITKKHISRRTLLRGAGTALALPLLDAMIPAFTAEAKTAAKTAAAFLRRLRAAWRGTGLLDSREGRRIARRTAVHLEADGAVPQAPEHPDRPAFALVRAASG